MFPEIIERECKTFVEERCIQSDIEFLSFFPGQIRVGEIPFVQAIITTAELIYTKVIAVTSSVKLQIGEAIIVRIGYLVAPD